MISSIFGQSKPINYIIILGFLILVYALVSTNQLETFDGPEKFLLHLIVLGVLLFSIMVANFIVKRNQISGTNDFTIFYYALLIALFSEALMDYNAIMSSFFLLLSMRRLISLRSLKSIKLKLFDATFWIVAASLFYDWALAFIVLVFICIYTYEPKNFRNWLVPLAGLTSAGILIYSALLLVGNTDFLVEHYRFYIFTDSNPLYSIAGGVKILLYLLLVVVAGIVAFVKLGKLGMGKIVTMRIIAIAFFIGIIVTIFKSSETISPIMITFFPASVIFTKYVEVIKRVNIKEVTLILSVVVPFMVFLAEMIAK